MDSHLQGPPDSLPFPVDRLGQLKDGLQIANRYTTVWLTILLFDHLATFESEFLHIWQTKLGLFKMFFLLNRYGSMIFVTTASALTLATIPADVCQKIAWISPFSGTFVVFVCDVIMSLRIDALYERNKTIRALLSITIFTELAIMIGISTRLHALVLPAFAAALVEFRGCTISAKDASQAGLINSIFWAAPLAVATLFLVLTLYRSHRAMRESSRMPLYERFVVGQLKYFVVVTVTHLANVVLISQRNEPTVQTMNITASIVLTSVCSSRLVLGFYEPHDVPHHHHRHHDDHPLSKFRSIGTGTRGRFDDDEEEEEES